ncbi:hypothetical protein L5I01_00840 [Gordonia sp. HY442]|uniref:hypothetical protein n=1 Tax=Gordonia zhenghanii TaxID=2911516 RepID=UPI001F1D234C|nr:hypothetical protein [Gordonia zhenghanii]MCF8601898.1 hypothetical protein [Gordonia zhenghanii]
MTDPSPSRFERLKHIYHTRVRTTTVVLVVVWFVLLGAYNFTSQHYPPKESARPTTTTEQPVKTREPAPETTESTSETPSTTVESTTESTAEPTETTDQEPQQGEGQQSTRIQPRRSAPLQTQLTEQGEPSSDSDTSGGGGR